MEHRTKYSKLKDIIRLNNFFTLELLVDILQGHFSLLFSLCPLTKPSGAIYKENFYKNIYYSKDNDQPRECRGRLHVDIWLKKQRSQLVMMRLWSRCMVRVLTAEVDSWEDEL